MNTTISEITLKVGKIKTAMREEGLESLLLTSVPNCLYILGSVIQGYMYVHLEEELPLLFLERPTHVLEGYPEERINSARKPELIPELLAKQGRDITHNTAVELSYLPMTDYRRLTRLSTTGLSSTDASLLMRRVRSIKTEQELTEICRLAEIHMEIYRLIPELYQAGMTELGLQHLLEYQMRRRGSIGLFRAFGARTEIFMGNIISGPNANFPAPYDFTMGGKGVFAMPIGASEQEIKPGTSVMVDMSGNFGVYQTDITRTYYIGTLPQEVLKAHRLSIELQSWFEGYAKEGATVSEAFNHSAKRAEEEGLSPYFMGYANKVKFVGHGVGVEINEMPVLTARTKEIFRKGMVIAFEPKFVFPEVGAVGVENTYVVGDNGAKNITPLPQELIPLPYDEVQ